MRIVSLAIADLDAVQLSIGATKVCRVEAGSAGLQAARLSNDAVVEATELVVWIASVLHSRSAEPKLVSRYLKERT